MTDYYVDSEWVGAETGDIATPFTHWNQLSLTNDDTAFFKRGSEFPDGEFLISNLSGVTLDCYGDATDPLPVFRNLIYSTAAEDWTDTGGNIWTLDTEMSSRTWYIMSFGNIDTFYPRIDTTDDSIGPGPLPLTKKGDWDYILGTGAIFGYFKVYCTQNPYDEWGDIGHQDYYQGAIKYNRQGGTVQNLAFTACTVGVFITSWTTANTMTGMDVNNCEFNKVFVSLWVTGLVADATAIHQDCSIHHNKVTNYRGAGIRISDQHRNTIIENNTFINGGLQESSGAIYAGRTYGTTGEPVLIRNNLVNTYAYFNYWNDGDGIYTDVEGEYINVYQNAIYNMDLVYGSGLRSNAGMTGEWYSNIVVGAAYGSRLSNATNGTNHALVLKNNTFIDIAVAGWIVTNNFDSPDAVTFANNCFVGTSAVGSNGAFWTTGSTGTVTATYNSYYNFETVYGDLSSAGTGDVTTDPQLLGSSYRLESNSPCIGTGDDLALPLTDYFDLAFVSPINIGAHSGSINAALATSAGATISLSLSAPASQNFFAYNFLTYTEVEEAVDLGEFGKSYQLVSQAYLEDRRTDKKKGAYNNGVVNMQLAKISDAGQALAYNGLASDDPVSVEIKTQDGGLIYFQAMVMSFTSILGNVDSIYSGAVDLEITSEIFEG